MVEQRFALVSPIPPLRWRIKESFDNYVRMQTADGEITVADGAKVEADGTYVFPPHPAAGEDATILSYLGAVQFRAHLGVLSLRIAAPRLEIADGAVRLYVADETGLGSEIELATAVLGPETSGRIDLSMRLTERGSEFFFGKYEAGEALASVTVELNAPTTGHAG